MPKTDYCSRPTHAGASPRSAGPGALATALARRPGLAAPARYNAPVGGGITMHISAREAAGRRGASELQPWFQHPFQGDGVSFRGAPEAREVAVLLLAAVTAAFVIANLRRIRNFPFWGLPVLAAALLCCGWTVSVLEDLLPIPGSDTAEHLAYLGHSSLMAAWTFILFRRST